MVNAMLSNHRTHLVDYAAGFDWMAQGYTDGNEFSRWWFYLVREMPTPSQKIW
jgi:hypothetical protein